MNLHVARLQSRRVPATRGEHGHASAVRACRLASSLSLALGSEKLCAGLGCGVQDMAAFMRSHLLGDHGAMQSGHRRRSDVPVRDVQAHAWQQRTRGAAEEGRRACRGGRVCPKEYGKIFSFLHREIHTMTIFLSWASVAEEGQ